MATSERTLPVIRTSMEYGKTLIDKAAEKCGSRYKLAKQTGISEGNLCKVHKGERSMPAEWAPLLAEQAGVDPVQALAQVVAEQAPEGSRVRALLGGVFRTGVAGMLLACVSLGHSPRAEAGPADACQLDNLYIVECWQGLRRLFFRARGLLCGWAAHRPQTMAGHA